MIEIDSQILILEIVAMFCLGALSGGFFLYFMTRKVFRAYKEAIAAQRDTIERQMEMLLNADKQASKVSPGVMPLVRKRNLRQQGRSVDFPC